MGNRLPPTTVVLERYEIIKELGRGGMGVVYQVMDTQLKRIVAMKVLLDSGLKAASLQRFMREAKLSSKMSHPNIVQVYEFGVGPQFYIIMEFIQGHSFQDLLEDKTYPLRKKLAIFQQVCEAMEYAHQQKIIHRDLKPQNIMVTHDNIAKVMDFGLAKSLTLQSVRVSKTGQVLGTLQYMSPEQAEGRKLDPKSDIYSLGVILYKILTNHTPYEGDSAVNILAQLAESDPPLPSQFNPSVPKTLQAICMKCLEKNPGNRYESAQLLANDIQSYLENKPITIHQKKRLAKNIQWMQKNKMFIVMFLALVLSWGILGILYEPVEEKEYQQLVLEQQAQTEAQKQAEILRQKRQEQSYGLPIVVWQACQYEYQGEMMLDMTTNDWCSLSPSQQSQYAGVYQKGYAMAKNLPLEINVPLANLPSGAKPLTMMLIPPGRFWMGSPDQEPGHNILWQYAPRTALMKSVGCNLNEGPRHRVVISAPYYLAKYECTQAQWVAVMGNNPSGFQNAGQDAPVEKVTWNLVANGSSSFCDRTGLSLPSECQWEYACRAGTTGMTYAGNFEIKAERNAPGLSSVAWYGGNSGVSYAGGFDTSSWANTEQNHPKAGTNIVGQKLPNGFALYDTLGNVLEWCCDNARNYTTKDEYNPKLIHNPPLDYIRRGGSWYDGAGFVRCANRDAGGPTLASRYLGFRPAKWIR